MAKMLGTSGLSLGEAASFTAQALASAHPEMSFFRHQTKI